MDEKLLKGAVEAIVFASERPVKLDKIIDLLTDEEKGEAPDRKKVREVIGKIVGEYEEEGRGIFLDEVAGGYQFRTKKDFGTLIQKLKAKRPPRFGRASMEVLAIVAYRQPMTRMEIEDLRGVDSGGALRGLLEKRFVRILGKKEVPGRPMIYGTTNTFLEHFGLRDLSQLPALKEFVELGEKETEMVKALEEKVASTNEGEGSSPTIA